MDMLKRQLFNTIKENRKDGFVNIVYGPRRVGKTTLLQQIVAGKSSVVWFNGDTKESQEALSNTSEKVLSDLVSGYRTVIIDEAQRIKNVGLSLKILVDKFPKKAFFVSGSSSLKLSQGLQESLTGRNLKYRLFPLSTVELTTDLPPHQKKAQLSDQLIFGGYPYLLQLKTTEEKHKYLKSVVSDYLFRDTLELRQIEHPENLEKLAKLLAFQIGSEVSYNELAANLVVDVKTVRRYLSLLKQSFVIFELGSYSKNLRKEVAKSKKYYFWDLGIRNALIDQFHPLGARVDKGQLWENFLAVERLKKYEYAQKQANFYFWRTYEQAEIDWIEEIGGKLFPFEFKWQAKTAKTPKAFKEEYGEKLKIISGDNYLDFVN